MFVIAKLRLILICSLESINFLDGSPVVNRDADLTQDCLKDNATETFSKTGNQNDTMLRYGLPLPEEENIDNYKTIIIIVVVMLVFILLTIFNHVIVPKVK